MDNDTQRQAKINRAYELRLSGNSYRAIGQALDVSHVTARKWVTDYLDSVTLPLVDEIRKQEVDRLLRYLERLDVRIDDGDDKAIALAIKISERLCKMLGADMPTVTVNESLVVTEMDMDIRRLIDAQRGLNDDAKRIAAQKGIDDE